MLNCVPLNSLVFATVKNNIINTVKPEHRVNLHISPFSCHFHPFEGEGRGVKFILTIRLAVKVNKP